MPFQLQGGKYSLTCDGGSFAASGTYEEAWVSCDQQTTPETDPYVAVQAATNAGWRIVEDSAYCPTHATEEL